MDCRCDDAFSKKTSHVFNEKSKFCLDILFPLHFRMFFRRCRGPFADRRHITSFVGIVHVFCFFYYFSAEAHGNARNLFICVAQPYFKPLAEVRKNRVVVHRNKSFTKFRVFVGHQESKSLLEHIVFVIFS